MEFGQVKETVRAVMNRLDSPSSNYSLVLCESDSEVEVSVEAKNSLLPVFVFVVDAESMRVLRGTELDPNGYAKVSYRSYVELISYLIEYFYPVFFRLTGGSVLDMMSRVFGTSIRVWKDLLRVVCDAVGVEHLDFGDTFKVLGVNFSYNLQRHVLVVSGDVNEEYQCPSVMGLVVALLTVLAFVFNINELDVNPLVDSGLEESESVVDDMEEVMGLSDDIDGMGDGGFDGGGFEDDLSAEFEPADESLDSTTPDIEEGKEEIIDDIAGGGS
jgi:hypothetical protein